MTTEKQNKQRYDSAGEFSERLAIVKPNGKYGLIDEVVPPIDGIAYRFKNGYADVLFKDKWRTLDRNDNEVIPCKCHIAKNVFADGLIWVKLSDTWLQVDCAGNLRTQVLKIEEIKSKSIN